MSIWAQAATDEEWINTDLVSRFGLHQYGFNDPWFVCAHLWGGHIIPVKPHAPPRSSAVNDDASVVEGILVDLAEKCVAKNDGRAF